MTFALGFLVAITIAYLTRRAMPKARGSPTMHSPDGRSYIPTVYTPHESASDHSDFGDNGGDGGGQPDFGDVGAAGDGGGGGE